MVLLVILLLFIAAFSYYVGCLNTLVLASHLIFKRNLMAYEKNNLGITRFLKDSSFWQLVWFAVLALVKFGFPVLLGGWLMSIYDMPEVGRAFAMLCMMLGNCFPYSNEFKGQSAIVAFVICSLFLNAELGIAEIIIIAIVYYFSRYISLSAMIAAFVALILSIVIIDISAVTLMVLVCALTVFVEFRKSIPRLIKGEEEKFIYRKDLSYMFDEK